MGTQGKQTPGKLTSGKQRIYTIANATWKTTRWIWTTIIIVFLLQFIPSYLLFTSNPNNPTLLTYVIEWFNDSHMPFPWNALRILAIIAIPLLASITFLAWILEQILRKKRGEGLERIVDLLECDTITPFLEDIQRKFGQLLQEQTLSVKALSGIGNRLQQMPATNDLKKLQIVAYEREFALKKKADQVLQDIHTRAIEQARSLGDLFQQSQQTEKTISADLCTIICILEQLQDKVEVAPLPERLASETQSDQSAKTKPLGRITAGAT